MDPFPGWPKCFFHKTVKIRYKPLKERRWSSAKGRGADRDFNFSVLELYKSSIVINLPHFIIGEFKKINLTLIIL